MKNIWFGLLFIFVLSGCNKHHVSSEVEGGANTPTVRTERGFGESGQSGGSSTPAPGSITTSQLADGAVTASKVNASDIPKLSGDNTFTGKITANDGVATTTLRGSNGIQLLGAVTGQFNMTAPTNGATVTLTTPPDAGGGVAGKVLSSNGYGVLSWLTPATALPPNGSAGGDLTGTYPNPIVALFGSAVISNGGTQQPTLTTTVVGSTLVFQMRDVAYKFHDGGDGGMETDQGIQSGGFRLISGGSVVWNNGGLYTSIDTGISRVSAGLIEANNGTIGSFRDVRMRHLLGDTATLPPTIAAGVGAGTTPTIAIAGNDMAGVITLTTGTLPTGTNAVVATVTFGTPYGTTSYPVLYPANATTATLSGVSMVFVTGNASTWTITSGTTALTAATAYTWTYHVGGK